MEVKIKYSILTYGGKKTSKVETYKTCPDFEVIKNEPINLGGELIPTDVTVADQIDEWVSSFDKKLWMDINDIQTIFDWKIVSAQSKNLIVKQKSLTHSEMVGVWLNLVEGSEEFKANFIAVYSELKPAIKGLKYELQIDITLKSISLGVKSAINAYESLKDYQKFLDNINLDEYKSISYGKTSYNFDKIKEDFNNSLTKKLK